jgi:hypothetical protein
MIMSFFATILEDLEKHRPDTTEEEKQYLVQIIQSLLQKPRADLVLLSSSPYEHTENDTSEPALFLWRPLIKDTLLPHALPSNYRIFQETSEDIYSNLLTTLNNLQGNHFNSKDIDEIVLGSQSCIKKMFGWSNTSILLEQVMKRHSFPETNVFTFGSPVLIPVMNCKNAVNIYHENDWMLDFVAALYHLNVNSLERNVMHTFLMNGEMITYLYIVTETDPSTTPHRHYHLFV